ncbi:MAG: hypothetical protein LBQ93_02355 [Treponema sp.]|jgi:hypothetical protein|nr:hypothetical protein [Treponema sp.]
MKRKIFIFIIFSVIFTANASSIDFSAYFPIEYDDFINIFKSTGSDSPGMSYFGNKSFRVRAILRDFPRELDNADIDNIRSTLRSLGFNPNMASQFGYKIEYVFASNVDWQEETRLVFYIQKIQRQYFENEYNINDTIYWFLVFNQFNTFTQRGYFLVSDFINEEQFVKFGLK